MKSGTACKQEGAAEGGASTARDAAGGAAEPAADAEEDPAVRERLRRVRGDPSEQDLSLRVFVGGMPFSYEVRYPSCKGSSMVSWLGSIVTERDSGRHLPCLQMS